MMRRRFRGSRFPRKAREPVLWDRATITTQVDTSGVFGQVAGVTIFDPTAVITGAQDLRLTVRRVRCLFNYKAVYSTATPPMTLYYGIYVAGAGEALRSPAFAGAGDQRTDWLLRGGINVLANGSAATLSLTGGQTNTIDGNDLVSARAMRKLDQDQTLQFVVQMARVDPGADVAPTITR